MNGVREALPVTGLGTLMVRPKHTDPGLERILRGLESQQWRVEKGNRYFKAWCPCDLKHWKTVHLTPSSRCYELNLRKALIRMCWTENQ